MGWKQVKEHYGVKHMVHVDQNRICIGSSFIRDIIVVNLDGTIAKRYDDRANPDLLRYQTEMDADLAKLRQLIETPDHFAASIPVFTYDGGKIIEKRCEEPGWPNVTHDGELMYENTFSTDKAIVIGWAKRNADAAIRHYASAIDEAEKRLRSLRNDLAAEEANRAGLEAEYPATESGVPA